MKRPFLMLLVCVFLCCSFNMTGDIRTEESVFQNDFSAISQEPMAFEFINPLEGQVLSGNITVKVDAPVFYGIPLLLRWNNDSWIDLTNWYNSTSKLYEYPMDVTCLLTGNATFEIKMDIGHGTFYSSVEVTIKWYRPPILIVCDYYDTNITDYYTSALEILGYQEGIGYSTWFIPTNGSPAASDLLEYQFVIWFKGADSSSISTGERNAIETYLLNPTTRKLLLTGTEIVWRAYNGGGYEGWLSANFGVNDYYGDGSNSENILGTLGFPYSGTNYTYGGGDGSQMLGNADRLGTLGSSIGLFEYASGGYDTYAATRSPFVSGILFGFAFDAISTSTDRVDLLNRTLNYLEIYEPPQMNMLSPSEGELQRSPLLLAWESNSEIPSFSYHPTYKIFVDGQLVVDELVLETYQLSISDGNHTIRIVCEDNCGQRAYDRITIEIDATNPKNDMINFTEGDILKSGSLLILNITDRHLDNVVSGWDADIWVTFPEPYQTYLPSGDGVHIFHVNSTDTAGNWNYTQFSLTCDDTLPDISLTSQINCSSMNGATNIQLEINDTHLNIVTYHWDQETTSYFEPEFETPLPTAEGVHDLFVNATDIAGNQRLTHYQFFTDDTPPTISLLNISNYAVLQTGTQMNFQITDLHFDSAGCRWDSSDTVYYDDSSFALFAPPIEGTHQLIINATDEAGNSHSESFEFVIDNTSPEITLSSPVEGIPIIGGAIITVDIMDSHLTNVKFHWDLNEWTEWDAPYVTTAPMNDGFHSLFVDATDAAGNWIQVVFVFQIDNGLSNETSTTSTTIGIPIDFPTSLGILGIGVGIGLGCSVLIMYFLTRRQRTDKS